VPLFALAACAGPSLPPSKLSAPPAAAAREPPRPASPRAAPAPATNPQLDDLWIPLRPAWTDRYYKEGPSERRFVISALMDRDHLDRAHAVELQNHFRDLAAADPDGDPMVHFQAALQRVKAGTFEDRRDLARLARAPFIVVFDLDDTLYNQYYDQAVAKTCHDLDVTGGDGKRRYVALTPGWKDAIDRIVALGGAVVLFTANEDVNSHENAAVWTIDGGPLLASEKISGFLTNSHLVQQEKGEGAEDPRKGNPVQEPSKDLRAIDPSLRRVVLVDDNLKRAFQYRNLRLFKKFDAEAYCTAPDPRVKQAYARSLRRVADEVEDSARYAKRHGVEFVRAYLPFTVLGQVALTFLEDTLGLSRRAAIAYIREHPDVVDEDF
jgi:hypothetical protein